jgi:hypothetical protein
MGPVGRIRRHRLLTALAVAVVALLAVGWTVLRTEEPGPASVQDALDRFHDGTADVPSATPRPPAGVYTYEGEGDEHLSFPPLDQADGAEMPGTVRPEARGCWTLRLDFNTAHWQSWRYCPTVGGQGFAEVAGASGQRWDLGVSTVENVSHFVCDPPNPIVLPAGAGSVEHRCTGTNSAVDGRTTSEGDWRDVGVERRVVGGEDVVTHHYTGMRRLTGGQDGTEATDVWFRDDGLLVRYERDIEVRTGSPVGDITYTESGWFELTDLTPQR